MLSSQFISGADPAIAAIVAYLGRCGDPFGGQQRPVVVVADPAGIAAGDLTALQDRASAGEIALVVDASALTALAATTAGRALLAAAGVTPGTPAPAHPLRLRAGSAGGPLMARLHDLGEPVAAPVPLAVEHDGVDVLLAAPAGLDEVAVATWRPATNVMVLGVGVRDLAAGAGDAGLRLVHRLALRAGCDRAFEGPVPQVGILGFGAIGAEHLAGFLAAGMDVAAVCDRSDARLAVVTEAVPGVRAYAKADELLGDAGIDLVAISTPPDSHARWALSALDAGKHAIVEKPLALSAEDADAMLGAADGAGLTLAVYQNRRFDPDFLALERVVRNGGIGRVFHLEAFVGGYDHPCNYWHSDERVSGGTAFDWGSHYLDQILALVPGQLSWVRGSAHKLRWHDVTNADQVRIQLGFADGTEAEFVHSDVAAALKPKWYVLGTEGAIVGQWRTERVVARNAIGTLAEDRLAPADSPATMWQHHPDGSRTELALPSSGPGRYHRELADRLLLGEPMTADPLQSRDVVAVLAAAVRSAADGGRPQPCPLRSR